MSIRRGERPRRERLPLRLAQRHLQQLQMAANVGANRLCVCFRLAVPQRVEAAGEITVAKDQAVGDMDELAGIVVFKQRGQLLVGEGVERRMLARLVVT